MVYLIRYIWTIALVLPIIGVGQNIKGRVFDQETNEAIPYVNIGVLRGDRGTVSDDQGHFFLDLTGENQEKILRFSFIGYESYDVSISEIGQSCSTYCDIQLIPKILEMQEIVVFPREYAEKIVGNPNPLKHALAGFTNDSLGYEMGIRVKIKKRPTLLKELHLHGLVTTYDSVFYRLNVYEMKAGKPGSNILKEPIYITLTDFEPEDIVIDLTPYHIMVQDDFLISLEYVTELGEGMLQLRTGMLSGKIFFRRTSQAEWHSAPLGLGMSVLTRYQK